MMGLLIATFFAVLCYLNKRADPPSDAAGGSIKQLIGAQGGAAAPRDNTSSGSPGGSSNGRDSSLGAPVSAAVPVTVDGPVRKASVVQHSKLSHMGVLSPRAPGSDSARSGVSADRVEFANPMVRAAA